MFGSWVQNELDHKSFFSHGWYYIHDFIQVLSFCKQSLFKLGCETIIKFIGIVLSYSHQGFCVLCHLCKINNGIHTYQFTFELLTLLFLDVVVVLDLNKILVD